MEECKLAKNKLIQALNDQMNFELYSGYIYKQMAAYADQQEYDGFGHWLEVQYQEEYSHAMKFYTLLNDFGEYAEWDAMPKPDSNFESLLDVFQKALDHEKEVTRRIHELVDIAREVDCKQTESFLQWFVDEQLEEEVTFGGIVTKLERVSDSVQGLYILDAQMARRES